MARDWEGSISLVAGRPKTVEWNAFHQATDQEGGPGFWRVLKENLIETRGHFFNIARADAQSNDRVAALNEVERCVSGHVFHSVFLGADPALGNLHSEARFQAPYRSIGVPCK